MNVDEKMAALEEIGLELFGMLRSIYMSHNVARSDVHDLLTKTTNCFKQHDVFRIDEMGNPIPRKEVKAE